MTGLHPAVVDTLIEPLLNLWTTIVATPPDATDTILGYLNYSVPSSVGFIYVREDASIKARRHGLGRQLLAAAGIEPGEVTTPFIVTNQVGNFGVFAKFAAAKGYKLRHRPYLPLQISAEMLLPRGSKPWP